MVRNTININFNDFIHNKSLYTGDCNCTHRRRVYHRKLINDTILAYKFFLMMNSVIEDMIKQMKKFTTMTQIHGGKWIFIRFNPDTNVSKIVAIL